MKSITERFMERVFVMTEGRGCWLWTGKVNSSGYGLLMVNGKDAQATRLSLTIHRRPPQPGECALHKCHTPSCCNPDHLYWGSKKDNTRDQIERGTFYYTGIAGRKGEDCPSHRLVTADVIEIRRLHWKEGESLSDIGRKYGMKSGQISRICHGLRWGHIKEGLPTPEQATPTTTAKQQILRCIAVLSILRNTLLRSVS